MFKREITQNPFIFGTVVRGAQFVGRKTERQDLFVDIKNHTNLIIYGPRRYGKTSLLLQTFADIKKTNSKFIGLYIDFFKVHSREKFLQIVASEIAHNSGWTAGNILDHFRSIVGGVQPVVTIDNDGKPVLQLSFRRIPNEADFEEILSLPKDLADKGYQVAVLMDEFQEIVRLNGKEFQRELRAVIQHHSNVSYIFCGSKEHLIEEIFNQSNSPLYNIGKSKYINKIPLEDFIDYLQNNIALVQPGFDQAQAKSIYQITDGIPYYVQMLAYEYYNLAVLNSDTDPKILLTLASEKLIDERNEHFTMLYERLNPTQKKILEIVLAANGVQVLRQEIISEFKIATATLRKGLTTLRDQGILIFENKIYSFQDIIFKRWLEKYLH